MSAGEDAVRHRVEATTPSVTAASEGDLPRRQRVWLQRLRRLGMGAFAVALFAALVALFVFAPDFYPEASYPPEARATAIGALRTAAMAGFVGLAAIGTLVVNAVNVRINTENLQVAQAAARAAQSQVFIASQRQITERYATAVELLGTDNEMSIVGGIYALERLAGDSERDRAIIVEVLAALVRDRAGLPEPQVAGAAYQTSDPDPELDLDANDLLPSDRELPLSVRTAMTVLGRIAPRPPAELGQFDALVGTARIAFAEAVRDGGAGADLRRVNLRGIDLPHADLRGANLCGADLTNANLAGADLRFASLEGADFTNARLIDTKFMGTCLSQAYFNGADMSAAIFGPGEYPIENVTVTDARFDGAQMEETDVRGLHLRRARGLTQGQIEDTKGDRDTVLPDKLRRPSRWPTDMQS
jgi:hypothetical protein